jgi:hypothetical protein
MKEKIKKFLIDEGLMDEGFEKIIIKKDNKDFNLNDVIEKFIKNSQFYYIPQNIKEIIIEKYNEIDIKNFFLNGVDEAIIGIDENDKIIYSKRKIIELLTKDMTEEDSVEFFDYNFACLNNVIFLNDYEITNES